MEAFLIATASGLIVTSLGAIVALLWNLNTLTATQNGALARVIKDFDDHRVEDQRNFTRVHDRLDRLNRDPLLG